MQGFFCDSKKKVMEAHRFVFKVEYYDDRSSLSRNFVMTFLEGVNSKRNEVSLFDCDQKRMFLKKTPVDLTRKDLFIGNSIHLFSREMKIVEYADKITREFFTQGKKRKQPVWVYIAKFELSKLSQVIKDLEKHEYCLTNIITQRPKEALHDSEEENDSRLEPSSGDTLAVYIEAMGEVDVSSDGDKVNSKMFKKFEFIECLEEEPEILKKAKSCMEVETTVCNINERNCSLVTVKPHVIRDSQLGSLLADLDVKLREEKLRIECMQLIHLTKAEVNTLLSVYEGILADVDFVPTKNELSSGVSLSMQVVAREGVSSPGKSPKEESVVSRVRRICGFFDVNLSKQVKPDSLRAKFGVNRIQNALHCTDLEGDGNQECIIVFDPMHMLDIQF